MVRTRSPARMPPVHYVLHDLIIQLACEHPRIEAMLEATLAYKGATRHPDGAAQAADISLTFAVSDTLPDVPRTATAINNPGDDLAVHRDEEAYYLQHPQAVVRVDPHAQRAEGRVTPALAQATDGEQLPLFYLTILSLVVLLQQRGLLVMHAAALARAQQGLLLIGHSGSGKSTTAFNLVRRGWGYLSDDTVLLRRRDDAVEVLSFRKDFCIAPEAAEVFPELRGTSWPPSLSNPEKWSVDVRALYDAPALPRCRPRHMLFPMVEPDVPSRTEPMSDKEAFVRLAYQTPIWIARGSREGDLYAEMLRHLLSQTTSHHLVLGRDVLDAPRALEHLVRSVTTP